jgi:Site-specific DNA methylase
MTPRSKLFFEYVRMLQEIKPRYFLLENVKMRKESEDVITEMLGVEPIEINSQSGVSTEQAEVVLDKHSTGWIA